MINKQIKAVVRKYIFATTVLVCGIIFSCGTLTASQKTAYNIYLKEYSVMTLTNTSERVGLDIDGEGYFLPLPDEEGSGQLKKLLKLTPLAPFVYLAQLITEK